MTAHLTDEECRAYATGAVAAEDLLAMDDHLSACRECHRRAATVMNADGAAVDVESGFATPELHLTDAEIQAYARRSLAAAREADMRRHLDHCAVCAGQVSDLRAWMASSPSRRGWVMAAAAVVLLVLIPAAIWMRGPAGRPDRQKLTSRTVLESVPPSLRESVSEALDRGEATVPAAIDALAGQREVLMGADRTTAFVVTEPVATATTSNRPRFQWTALDGAESYVVSVFDENLTLVQRGESVRTNTWQPAQSLPRGRTYLWQVTAQRRGGSLTAPAAPAPPAKFQVLDRETSDTLGQLRTAHPEAHVVIGIVAMQAGALDEARAEFSQVPDSDPHADVARRSLAVLAGRR